MLAEMLTHGRAGSVTIADLWTIITDIETSGGSIDIGCVQPKTLTQESIELLDWIGRHVKRVEVGPDSSVQPVLAAWHEHPDHLGLLRIATVRMDELPDKSLDEMAAALTPEMRADKVLRDAALALDVATARRRALLTTELEEFVDTLLAVDEEMAALAVSRMVRRRGAGIGAGAALVSLMNAAKPGSAIQEATFNGLVRLAQVKRSPLAATGEWERLLFRARGRVKRLGVLPYRRRGLPRGGGPGCVRRGVWA